LFQFILFTFMVYYYGIVIVQVICI
jgi:hypothetical protein